MKILDGALRHSSEQAERYAGLLVTKLESDGDLSAARMIRERLAKIPKPAMGSQLHPRLPQDQESKGFLLDEERPVGVIGVFSKPVHKTLDEFIESIARFDELKAAGVDLPARLLMYGPPGCGKSLAARMIASRLGLPLFTVRCDALVSSLLGQTGRNLREVFDYADRQTCVLFLDEFDALAKARSHAGEVGELQRVVIALLQNLDSLREEVVVIAATNHQELLDPAIWRRFSLLLPMEQPGFEQRQQLWVLHLGQARLESADVAVLAELSDGMSGAAIKTAAHDVVRDCVLRRESVISLPRALVRLARIKWLSEGHPPREQDEEIRWLRDWAPKVFTWKAIESTFDVSGRRVKHLLGDQDDRPRNAGGTRGVRTRRQAE
ncbi:AAA family ATPase [Xanthomonas campestris]|uniref:AAA family ATPase n=1 Tax=Xanthomonas campestris TaxID=339 RepID=UPI001E517895|nr:ATP-binding protein [Xanthomonas campestris]MCC8485744.1 ATP-binding protein [Xanthomonas campestris]MEA9745057.1 ATP-binding protein [Xanthomonas campestris pv. raphani]MEA9769702.1 ATP-binding protein [Xanthomonas campestris pv. raphani]MEA9870052.1 ATP-binding protein [Xanthomonas campestris pv. raphani]